MPVGLRAQYTEDFSIAGKGILSPGCTGSDLSTCSNTDFDGVNWTMGGDLSGIDVEGFSTSSGVLSSSDFDEESCWLSPTLDISSAGSVTLSATIHIPSGTGWETSTTPGSVDYADVRYAVNDGGFTTIANVNGCSGSGHTVSASSCASGLTGPLTYTPNASGITGNTLNIEVCFDTNSGSDFGELDQVSVPQANVVVLPVVWASFSTYLKEDAVLLEWETTLEWDSYLFEVEHSVDGASFETIGEVAGQGTSATPKYYTFLHDKAATGVNYYRLKQIDYDGTFVYSVIRKQYVQLANDVRLTPNPVSAGTVFIDYTTEREEQMYISLYNAAGEKLRNWSEETVLGTQRWSLDVSTLFPGMYIVYINSASRQYHQRFFVSSPE